MPPASKGLQQRIHVSGPTSRIRCRGGHVVPSGFMSDSRIRAEEHDAKDPLARFRDRFVIADPALVYLDGNSLGRLPTATRARLRSAIDDEWGAELIRGWEHWIALARSAGDVLA